MSLNQRLTALRKHMQHYNIDYYLVPSIDEHNSEYVPECWQRRTWISNFDGSAGEALISLDHGYLSTDGRYFLQASQQLDAQQFTLLKQSGYAPETQLWLKNNAHGKKVGVDPKLIGIERFKQLSTQMLDIGGELVAIDKNLIDLAKHDLAEQVILPQSPAIALAEKYSGMSTTDKLNWLRHELANNNSDYIAINVLDEIAWLFNIRGEDIQFNPYVISYAIIGATTAELFVDNAKISPDLLQILDAAGISLKDYSAIGDALSALTGEVILDASSASQWMYDLVRTRAQIKLIRSPIVMKKALKNPVEINGMRTSHRKDAVAMVNFFHWLENNWQNGVDEISVADKLEWFRSQQENIKGLSFATISGYASNGAIMHYRATPQTVKKLGNDNLYLLDSGGQYLDGTTDTTRTIHLGVPSAEHIKNYTLVLKGHLALSRAIFVRGTRGDQLDILARSALWSNFKNYRHGTGHGVGCFLGVHEGPQRISQAPSMVALEPGMVLSNEPGYYVDGEYGIRIENLCLVTEINSAEALNSEFGPFYGFEDLTLLPYCKRLIDVSLLSEDDKAQIKTYYQKIRELILPQLSADVAKWLEDELDIPNL